MNINKQFAVFNPTVGVDTGTNKMTPELVQQVASNEIYVGWMWIPVLCVPVSYSSGTYYYPIYLPNVELECCLVANTISSVALWSVSKDEIIYEDDAMIDDYDLSCKLAYNYFLDNPNGYLTIPIQDPDTFRDCTLIVFNEGGDVPAFTFYYRLTGEYTPVGSEE